MKTNKKLYSIVLSLAMMLSVVSPSFASVVDYGEEWQYYPTTTYSQVFSDVPISVKSPLLMSSGMIYRCDKYLSDAPSSPFGPPYTKCLSIER